MASYFNEKREVPSQHPRSAISTFFLTEALLGQLRKLARQAQDISFDRWLGENPLDSNRRGLELQRTEFCLRALKRRRFPVRPV